ncbi:MAG: hypothetical protein Kow006_11420 [Gammaproteobacteria bacterium]
MTTLLLITTCLGVGVFIGMLLSAAFSSGREPDALQIAQVLPTKNCYHCSHQLGRVDDAL